MARGAVVKDGILHILLIEDAESDARLIADSLASTRPAMELTRVGSLAEAREELSRSVPDLMIVDLLLPDGLGTELLETGDALPCPVVVMTGHGNEELAVRAMRAGATDYVVKSASTLKEMPAVVEKALHAWQHILMRRSAEEAVERKRRKFQDLVETINDWVWEVDLDGVYTYASPKVLDLLGYQPEEILGKSPFDLMAEDEAKRLKDFFRQIARQRKPFWNVPNTNRHKDGHEVILETSGLPFYDSDGSFAGYRGVDRDITDRKRAADRLREVNRELAAFAHTVSHDLRTPLTAIIGFSEFLRDQYGRQLDGQGTDILTNIIEQGRRMMALMEDLLSLARIGHLQRPSEVVQTADLVKEVVAELRGRIVASRLELRVGDLPAVHLAAHFLAEIFENLIGNALEYAGEEGGPIEVGGRRSGQQVRFFVRDHGPGVPEAERDKIFEVFSRGSTGSRTAGTGVGLAIVGKIATLCGGRAWVEQTPGGGSTFWVELVDTPPSPGSPSAVPFEN